jgi:flagellar basal body-associated protein FliL
MLSKRQKKVTITIVLMTVVVIVSIVVARQRRSLKEEPLIPKGMEMTDAGEIISKEEVKKQKEEVEKKNPLLKYVPYHNNHFAIEFDYMLPYNNQAVYKITLAVSLNNPNQLERYKIHYKQYKAEAIKWIEEKGIDYEKLKIAWEPDDPENIKIEEY